MSTYDDFNRPRGGRQPMPAGQQGWGQGTSEYSGSSGNSGRDLGRASEHGGSPHDPHYAQWRRQHADELDRDYDAWRQERQRRFGDEFSAWRSRRADTANRASTEDTDVDSGLSDSEVSGDEPSAAAPGSDTLTRR